jgi:hypothetical protein
MPIDPHHASPHDPGIAAGLTPEDRDAVMRLLEPLGSLFGTPPKRVSFRHRSLVGSNVSLHPRDCIGVLRTDRQPPSIRLPDRREADDSAPGPRPFPGGRDLAGHCPTRVNNSHVGPELADRDAVQHDGSVRKHVSETVGMVVLDLLARGPPKADNIDEVGVLNEESRQGDRISSAPRGGEPLGDALWT